MENQSDDEWAFSEETGHITGPHGKIVAFIAGGRTPTSIKNGNFIAAAPDLYAALQELLLVSRGNNSDELEMAQTALRKARGE